MDLRILLTFVILFIIQNTAKDHAKSCSEYFSLLCRLLNYAFATNTVVPNAEILLNNEIDWLKKIRVSHVYHWLLTSNKLLKEIILLRSNTPLCSSQV